MNNESSMISRRSFVKWVTATAAAAGVAGGLTACAPSGGEEPETPPDVSSLSGGEWVTVTCPGCAEFQCVNRVYVVDGIPIRGMTDEVGPNSPEQPQWRSCIKARAGRWAFLSPARIKFPMKRKSWSPGGGDGVNGHLRGKDEWERISWDEALQTAANELKRIAEEYGTGSDDYGNGLPILDLCYSVGVEMRCLNQAGIGVNPIWGQNSTGGWPVPTNKMVGDGVIATDRYTTMKDSQLIVLWGCNHGWSQYGAAPMAFRYAKERGAKIIAIDPWFNPGNNAYADEWIPCRPGTDAALMLAVCHELIMQDLVDQEFLDKYVVGYDEESMHSKGLYDKEGNPIMKRTLRRGEYDAEGKVIWDEESVIEVVDGQERHKFAKDNFKDYVLGTYDGTPKSAEWASQICGTPVDRIKSLATDMGTIKPMSLIAQQAMGRHYYGANVAQCFFAMGWMTGNYGKPGAIVTNGGGFAGGGYSGFIGGFYPGSNFYFGISAGEEARVNLAPEGFMMQPPNPKADVSYGAIGYPWDIQSNYEEERYYGIAFAEAWDAILEGKSHNFVHGMKDQNIKAIVKLFNGNSSNQNVNTFKAIQAHRAVEFVLAMDMFMNTTTRYADIVLPCTSWWEVDGNYNMLNPEMFLGNAKRIVEPLFESKASFDVDAALCELFEVDPVGAYPNGLSYKENNFTGIANAWVIGSDGQSHDPLISFTQEDLDEIGIEGVDAAVLADGRITYQEFKEQGFYKIEMNDGLKRYVSQFTKLMEDPTKPENKLSTQTGYLEIYSMNLENYYQVFGFDHAVKATPTYAASGQGSYEESTRGEYPYQYINVHPHHRVHSSRLDCPEVLEFFDDVLFVNPLDAEAIGLENDDTALLTSEAGRHLRRVTVTTTVMPGVIVGIEGATARLLDDEKTKDDTDWDEVIDYGGASNVLAPTYLVGQGHQAYNSIIVNVEKWTGEPLKPNYQWQLDVVDFE
ncbi:molybdopterin-dependent oxidoreductase [Raoultibacter phocaeensis]|uniref:molybdopterin-dependent oxidoreductase n=1 Tax=Raoultibacter phocaeensis TaxID=2479841 RepID=UPI001118CCB4|nr:molybdopterin-dependent oxidoreductase [Raoultibacter phocaeensis]